MIERVSATQAAYVLALCRIVVFTLLGLDVWSVYSRRPITEDDIERELHTAR